MDKNYKEIITSKGPQNSFKIAINDLDNFHKICNTYEIKATTISRTTINGREITYATFNTETKIDDIRMCYVIYGCLNRLFNSYEKPSLFMKALKDDYKLNINLQNVDKEIHIKSDPCYGILDIPYLVYAACHKVNKEASKGNASKTRNSFLTAINLSKSSLPLKVVSKKAPFQKSTFSCDAYKYILELKHENVEFIFNIKADDFIATLNGDHSNNICLTINSNSIDPKWDESVDISLLIASNSPCMLLKELCTGSRKVSLSQLRFVAKSLCNIRGAQNALEKSIFRTGLYENFVPSIIEYLMSNYRKSGYAERSISCQYFCPHHTSCNNAFAYPIKYMEDVLLQKKRTIRKLKEVNRAHKDKDTIRAEIANQFNEDFSSEDNNVYVYKCFVGLGKTRMYLEKVQEFIESNKTVIIALPTHALKDDVVRRLREDHLDEELIANKVLVIPDIPTVDVTFKRELDSFYSVGDYSGATKFMRDYADNLTADKQDIKETLSSYLETVSNLKNKEYTDGKIIFTTHERLLSLKAINPYLVIIDEDITNSILKIHQIKLDELHALKLKIENIISSDNRDDSLYSILDKINSILGATDEVLYSISANTKEVNKLRNTILKAITEDKRVYYNSKIIDLLFNSCTYIKNTYNGNSEPKSEVHFIYRRNLSFNCKVFIMSATSDQEICQRLLGQEMIVFREFDIPEMAASITMRYDYSFSKDWFNRNISSLRDYSKYLKALRDYKLCRTGKDLVRRDNKNQPLIITFKEYEAAFQSLGFNTLMHFGNTTGIDFHKGKNVAVFGTYNLHPIAYSLYTKAIYPEEPINKVPEYSDVLVENNDYRFYIHTSKEFSKFRKVQLWKVESEMIQALGRARPIDNKCLIRIYSNIPPAGIDITFI